MLIVLKTLQNVHMENPECKPEDHKAVTKITERYKNHRNTEAIISSEIEQ